MPRRLLHLSRRRRWRAARVVRATRCARHQAVAIEAAGVALIWYRFSFLHVVAEPKMIYVLIVDLTLTCVVVTLYRY